MLNIIQRRVNMARDIQSLKKIANTIRQDIIKMLAESGSGHPGVLFRQLKY